MKKVFIDGSAGTTGLQIAQRLSKREDLILLHIPEEKRKEEATRKAFMNQADIVFLCLPDAAAAQAVTMIENKETVVIDTSTAHRTNPEWIYGFPEICGRREKISNAKRIANPGCHASGFVALVAPLTECGLISTDTALTCFSITGYSGGGKSMIREYEDKNDDALYQAPRQYGLTQNHKHLPEMQHVCKLTEAPLFCPVVARYYSGMEVTVPLFQTNLKGKKCDVEACYRSYYRHGLVSFQQDADENGFLSAAACAGKDTMQITVSGNEERLLLIARFDNLGKGACGAAIQNMNLVLQTEETTGLIL